MSWPKAERWRKYYVARKYNKTDNQTTNMKVEMKIYNEKQSTIDQKITKSKAHGLINS